MDAPSSDSELFSERPPKRARHSSPQRPSTAGSSAHSVDGASEGLHSYPHMHTANGNGHSTGVAPKPALQPSILGVEPLDEFIREVADFIHYHISNRPPDAGGTVEVEAKIGLLKDRAGGQRLQLPILVETILAPDTIDLRFESNMSAKQHQHFNKLLNDLKIKNADLQIDYEHLHLIDNFFEPDRGREKIRVTRDEKTAEVRACMRKVRLGDLNIYCPKRLVDWRISVNMEIPVPPPLGTPTHTRRKDRLSYSHQEFAIDLTQVTATAGPNSKPEVLHELEVELKNSEYLVAMAAKRGDPSLSLEEQNAFDELIHAFVNNARILTRNATPAADGR
ncbi:mRNA triphosphatase CET1 [Ganoderma leucocontextum]|nr:mRNA triphosphatase CET1 [Ganoderma leucocontextum]